MAEQEQQHLIERKPGPHFMRFYANNINITFTQWDMRVTFGEMVDNRDGKTIIEDQATVVMSLQHAKVAIALLAGNLAELEKRYGEIKLLEPIESHIS